MTPALTLLSLMQTPLPSKTVQRRGNYRPTRNQITEIFQLLNEAVFDNTLPSLPINLRTMNEWGWFHALDDGAGKIKISNTLYCIQWFILILAHEMSHQHQWISCTKEQQEAPLDNILLHTGDFYKFKDRLAEFGIPLGEMYSQSIWFKTQDLFKV